MGWEGNGLGFSNARQRLGIRVLTRVSWYVCPHMSPDAYGRMLQEARASTAKAAAANRAAAAAFAVAFPLSGFRV